MRNFFTLDGIVFEVVEISQPYGGIEPLYNLDMRAAGYYKSRPEPATVETVVWIDRTTKQAYEQKAFIADMIYNARNYHKNIIGLGDGFVCEHCGNYTPSGGKFCLQCGAPMERVPYIAPWKFPLIPSRIDSEADIWMQQERITVEFLVVEDDKLVQFAESVRTGFKLTAIPHTIELDGRWVCRHCGRIIDEDKPCPTCGGQRLPFAELVKVDATCLYCARVTTDGPVCKGCQHVLNTITMREIARTTPGLQDIYQEWKGAM